jgi:hypothetical protein
MAVASNMSKTYMLCSKFSNNCNRILESLLKLQLSLSPTIQLVWIDHPTIREKLEQSIIKTVPCIITIDPITSSPTVYEGDHFLQFINNFIKTEREKPEVLPPVPQLQPSANVIQQQYQQQLMQHQLHQQQMNHMQQMQKLSQMSQLPNQMQQQIQPPVQTQQQQQPNHGVQHQHVQNIQPQHVQNVQPQNVQHVQNVQPQHVQNIQPQHVQNIQQQIPQQSQIKNDKTTGVTSLSSILDEKSLFDYQDNNDPMKRPRGTDVRDSDHSEASFSKRNSINQRVREMSSDRVVHPPKGVGHDSLAASSLRRETTALPSNPDNGSSNVNENSFELEEIDGEPFDDIPPPMLQKPQSQLQPQSQQSETKKKLGKPSIIDKARDMEKGRV